MRPARLSVTLLLTASALLTTSLHAQESEKKRYIEPSKHPSDVYFGDAHIHTRISVDSSLRGGPQTLDRLAA